MFSWKTMIVAAASAAVIAGTAAAPAQISVGIGVEPGCPYGYYDYAPYSCSPYGYYGPDWFNGGVFLGAGPWFHGPRGFGGHVDNRYDPRNGYSGPMPGRGDHAFQHFQGNESRDGQGHAGPEGHPGGGERSGGFSGGGRAGGGGGGSRGGGGHPPK